MELLHAPTCIAPEVHPLKSPSERAVPAESLHRALTWCVQRAVYEIDHFDVNATRVQAGTGLLRKPGNGCGCKVRIVVTTLQTQRVRTDAVGQNCSSKTPEITDTFTDLLYMPCRACSPFDSGACLRHTPPTRDGQMYLQRERSHMYCTVCTAKSLFSDSVALALLEHSQAAAVASTPGRTPF